MSASQLTVDHIIVGVEDRDEAAADFRALGFTVFEGGVHPDGHTHNNLIALRDTVYIELVAPTDKDFLKVKHEDHGRHWLFIYNNGMGFVGYALATDDLEATMKRIEDRGYGINGPHQGGRVTPDGRESVGQGISPAVTRYPAVTMDITPRDWRLPVTEERLSHDNGVTGVAGVVAMIADFDEGVRRYSAMLGLDPMPGSPVAGARTADFHTRDWVITVAAPVDKSSEIAQELEQRGEVPFLVRLRTSKPEYVGPLEVTRTHQARFEIVL
jgi:hypothetical protein